TRPAGSRRTPRFPDFRARSRSLRLRSSSRATSRARAPGRPLRLPGFSSGGILVSALRRLVPRARLPSARAASGRRIPFAGRDDLEAVEPPFERDQGFEGPVGFEDQTEAAALPRDDGAARESARLETDRPARPRPRSEVSGADAAERDVIARRLPVPFDREDHLRARRRAGGRQKEEKGEQHLHPVSPFGGPGNARSARTSREYRSGPARGTVGVFDTCAMPA